MDGEAPPVYGDDAVEIDGCKLDAYAGVSTNRKDNRMAREKAEDTFMKKEDYQLSFLQPRKERRFKVYIKYEGRKGPPSVLKVRLPLHGGYEDGPSIGIKKMFVNNYNQLRQLLSMHSVHLRSELGLAIPDDDSISGYVGYGGMIFVVDGSAPSKPAEDKVFAWGKTTFSSPEGDMPSIMLTLERKRIKQVAVGVEHAIALTEGGRVFSWGINDFGQLGTGDETSRMLPMLNEVPYDVFINSVSCGGRFTLALTKKGELYSWGRMQASNFPRLFIQSWCNGYACKGEMGLAGQQLSKVVGGDMHMVALTKEGKVYTWGYNDFGQLGWGLHGVDRVGQQKPGEVVLDDVVVDICAGGAHTVVVTKTGRVFGWGSNAIGQIGHGLRQTFPEPNEASFPHKITKCRAGWQCTFLISDSNKGITCGGIVADGPKISSGANDVEEIDENETQPDPVSGNVLDMLSGGNDLFEANVVDGAIGEAHGAVICEDGSVVGWGYNRQLQAVGSFTTATVAKPQKVIMADSNVSCWTASGIAVGGSQSYTLLRPPRY